MREVCCAVRVGHPVPQPVAARAGGAQRSGAAAAHPAASGGGQDSDRAHQGAARQDLLRRGQVSNIRVGGRGGGDSQAQCACYLLFVRLDGGRGPHEGP